MMIKFSDLGVMDRDPAFPIYVAWSYHLTAFPSDYTPGRMVNPRDYRDTMTGAIDSVIMEHVGPNDIVFVPLFLGDEGDEVYSAPDDSCKIPAYDENMRLVEELAPKVKAVMVGNAGPELSFKERWIKRANDEEELPPRKWMSEQMCEFMRSTAGIILNSGGTPCYGPVDWDVAIDCYYGDAIYRDLSNEIGALQYCACGYQLFGLQRRNGYPKVPDESDVFFWPCCPVEEDTPWPFLSRYLRGYDHIITGVGHLPGLIDGNDIVLAEHGFDAGCCAGITSPKTEE
jgi:hypothetical protein